VNGSNIERAFRKKIYHGSYHPGNDVPVMRRKEPA
jgi:hypothetical protein